MPIHFMHKSLPFTELCALYAVSDVCLVTSTRDGMNLVRRPRALIFQPLFHLMRVIQLYHRFRTNSLPHNKLGKVS
jgi:Glycosyltransferase family 20